jgi:nucleotide-binding universal stress UspA family protein
MIATPSSIVCATDFSRSATEAATVAAKLALRFGATLRLVHATDSRPRAHGALQKRLDAEAARLSATGATVAPLLLPAFRPTHALIEHLQTAPPLLVVAGCNSKGALDRWALGSFSEAIAEGAPVPTLVVRNPEVFETWDWSRSRLTMLLALDFTSSSDAVLRWARQFQRGGPCDFAACHVNWRTPTIEDTERAQPPANPPAVQQRLERDLRKKIRDQLGDDTMPVVVRAYFGDPGPGVVEVAAERKAQIVAIGTHQRHGLHRLARFSVSREVLHQAATNVVCVPVQARFEGREAHIPDLLRVLVATDLSDLGNTAVPYACAIGGAAGRVKIVHVAPAVGSTIRRNARLREELRGLIPDECAARGQTPEVEVLEAKDVPEAICAAAERYGADVVCLASHGLGMSRALHGSVAKAVLKSLRRPLLIVRRPGD